MDNKSSLDMVFGSNGTNVAVAGPVERGRTCLAQHAQRPRYRVVAVVRIDAVRTRQRVRRLGASRPKPNWPIGEWVTSTLAEINHLGGTEPPNLQIGPTLDR